MRPPEVFVRSLAHDEAVRLKRQSTRAKHQSTRIRAAILLASNVGMSVPEVARMWLTDDSHVRKVIHEFNDVARTQDVRPDVARPVREREGTSQPEHAALRDAVGVVRRTDEGPPPTAATLMIEPPPASIIGGLARPARTTSSGGRTRSRPSTTSPSRT